MCTTAFPRLSSTLLVSRSPSTSDSVVGVLSTLGVTTRSRVLQTTHGSHVSDVLRICVNQVSTSRTHDHCAKKEYLIAQSSQASHKAHHDLIRRKSIHRKMSMFGPNSSPSQHERQCECPTIIAETTRICHERVVTHTFQESHNMLVPQFRCFAISMQRFVQLPTASLHNSGSAGGSAINSWSMSACKNAVCTTIEIAMLSRSG